MPLKDAPDYDKEVKPHLKVDDRDPTVEHVALVVRDKNGIDKIVFVDVSSPDVEIFGYHRVPGKPGNEKEWMLWPRGSKLIGR